MDHAVAIRQEAVFTIDQIPRRLLNADPVRPLRDAHYLHSATLQVDHEEREVANETALCREFDREEVRRRDGSPAGSQDRLPGDVTTIGGTTSGIDSVLSEHALDRVSTDFAPEVHQRTASSRVSPKRILERHPNAEAPDFALDSRSPGQSLRAPVGSRDASRRFGLPPPPARRRCREINPDSDRRRNEACFRRRSRDPAIDRASASPPSRRLPRALPACRGHPDDRCPGATSPRSPRQAESDRNRRRSQSSGRWPHERIECRRMSTEDRERRLHGVRQPPIADPSHLTYSPDPA